ncbi:MAG: HAD domain-containing protein [Candidatus Thiodiazotropha endolucinida]
MIIFLDFDGVTHPRSGAPAFLPKCMRALREALDNFDAEIVVSSSWRETNHFWELVGFLKPLGKPVAGVTPVIDAPFTKCVRHAEIVEYLADNGQSDAEWIAIDDTPGFFPEGCQHVYFTDPTTGFTSDDVEKLLHRCLHKG